MIPGSIARRILVVDYNPDAAEALCILLTQLGHQTAAAHSGHEALLAARAFHPDTVLLDIGLPDIDGYEVARRLRATEEGRGAWLIAVTGWGEASDRERSAAAGFDAHLVKPVDPQLLARMLSGSGTAKARPEAAS